MNYGIPHIVSQSKDWNVSSLLSSLSVGHSLPFDVKEKYSTFQNHKDWDSFWKQPKHYHPEATLTVSPAMGDYLQVINTLRVYLSLLHTKYAKEKENIWKASQLPLDQKSTSFSHELVYQTVKNVSIL